MSEVTQTLTLRAVDSAAIDAAMTTALEARGFTVIPPGYPVQEWVSSGKWERVGDLAARIGLRTAAVSRLLKRLDCPKYKADLGPSGRIAGIVGSPELDAWLTARKRK